MSNWIKNKLGAAARLSGNALAPKLSGSVWFFPAEGGLLVSAEVFYLPPNQSGFYGFHLHSGPSCARPDFSDAEGHYNPANEAHPLHAGDFPVLLAANQGNAYLAFLTSRLTLCEVLGRTIVIHLQPDDYRSQPSGASGLRIACGIIRPVFFC